MINEQGGVNGRKINLISLDDGYSPPKTVEQIRRLVEQEQVAFLFNTLGTAAQCSRSGNISTTTRSRSCSSPPAPSLFSDPEHFPWTVGFNPNYQTEAQHLRQAYPGDEAGCARSECSTRTTASARII